MSYQLYTGTPNEMVKQMSGTSGEVRTAARKILSDMKWSTRMYDFAAGEKIDALDEDIRHYKFSEGGLVREFSYMSIKFRMEIR